MRPRPDAAENRRPVGVLGQRDAASMRPRPDAAENRIESLHRYGRCRCFNEAAARCRGKPLALYQQGTQAILLQ